MKPTVQIDLGKARARDFSKLLIITQKPTPRTKLAPNAGVKSYP